MKNNIVTKFLITLSVPTIAVLGHALNITVIVTAIYIPLLFIMSLFSNKHGHLMKSTPLKLYILFFLLSLLSVFNAIDTTVFLDTVKTQVGCVIFGLAMFNFILINPVYIKYFFFSCILTTYFFALYLFNSGALDLKLQDDLETRISDENFNANVFPYYIFLASFSFFFLFHLLKFKILKYLYFFSLPLYLYIILSSGSRGGLIIFILIQILYWFYIGTGQVQSYFKSTMKLLTAFILSLPVLGYTVTLMMDETNIGKRFDALSEEGEGTIRVVLAKLAFEKFLEYPFLGVGTGNFLLHNKYHLFSHNNFMEILVNNGIFTFIIYVSTFVVIVQKALAFKKKTNDTDLTKHADIIILFVLGFSLYSVFYVFVNVIAFTGFIFSIFALLYIIDYNVDCKRV